jgi:hypothetical protein
MAAVMRCGKQMEKLPYYFSWVLSFQNRRPMRDAASGDKTIPPSGFPGGGGVFVEEISRGKSYWWIRPCALLHFRTNYESVILLRIW